MYATRVPFASADFGRTLHHAHPLPGEARGRWRYRRGRIALPRALRSVAICCLIESASPDQVRAGRSCIPSTPLRLIAGIVPAVPSRLDVRRTPARVCLLAVGRGGL